MISKTFSNVKVPRRGDLGIGIDAWDGKVSRSRKDIEIGIERTKRLVFLPWFSEKQIFNLMNTIRFHCWKENQLFIQSKFYLENLISFIQKLSQYLLKCR